MSYDRPEAKEEIFGFETIDQALDWFNVEELVNLKKLGYELKRFKGVLVMRGKKQVLFKKIK